ncbi:MAG: restriction endonuclease subunit R [Leptolyngbyaceae cyanobacterium]
MVQVIAANQITLEDLETRFGLVFESDPAFFPECRDHTDDLSESERLTLDRVKSNFLTLLKRSVVLENIVKMVVLSPLLDLAGFYAPPYSIEGETSVDIEVPDRDEVIRGRIDVLVLNRHLWVLVIESKRTTFDVMVAVPQAWSYMLDNPDSGRPRYGLVTNGNLFLFLKLVPQPQPRYAYSRLFSLINPGNELQAVLQILRRLGNLVLSEQQGKDR